MNIKTLNTVIARVTDKVLEGKTLDEVCTLTKDYELRTKVEYKGNTYDFVVINTISYKSLNIRLKKNGACGSVYIDEDCIEDFEHVNTLSELLDDIYKEWETKVNDLSLDEKEAAKFIDVSI
ncbi:hypothetical protein KQUDLBSD_CDS0199 [Staphylococcus phage PG-2021_40]